MIEKLARPLAVLVLASGAAAAQSEPPAGVPTAPVIISSAAERVYAAARPKLLQIRTLIVAAGRQSSIGSGFLVSADGLAITNYHVVSQFALEPGTYRLEYATADGARGELKLLAIDVANDLAVVRLDQRDRPAFAFDERALAGTLPKGERLYSMGNPLDLGFSIVEGTYNGLVERSYTERIHFSGALNPGVSGGPAVAAEGRIVGVNVSKRFGGESVSFLVPAHVAVALLQRAQASALASREELRAEISRQLNQWQAGLYRAVGELGFRAASFGPYRAPESAAPWFNCWAQTNAGQIPKPRASLNMTTCTSDTGLFIATDLSTGRIQITHSYFKSIDLNAFQFAAFLSQQNMPQLIGAWSRKWLTHQRCHEDFVAAQTDESPALRVVWCARAYREFAGLYDVWAMIVTQNRSHEALATQLILQGTTFESGIALTRRVLEAVKWAN